MDATALLRAYHRYLDHEVWPEHLAAADKEFWIDKGEVADPAIKAATTAIWNAHVARVENRGSPADCDAALRDALKEIGP